MGKKYKYVYAEVLTGQLHLEEDHISLGHSEDDCYQLKESELNAPSETTAVTGETYVTPRNPKHWEQQLDFARQSIEDDDVPDSIKEMMHEWLGDRFTDIKNERDSF